MKHVGLIAKITISIGIFIVLAFRMNMDSMQNIAHHFTASAWICASLFITLQSFLLSWRWQILVNLGKHYLTLARSVQINFTSQLANLIFVTSIGGLVARITLSMQNGASLQKCLIASIVDRLMTFCALSLIAALFLPVFSTHAGNETFYAMAGYIGAAAIGLFLLSPFIVNGIIRFTTRRFRFGKRVRYFLRYIKILVNSPVIAGKTVALSLLGQMSFFFSVIYLTKAAGAPVETIQLIAILPVIALVASLPLSIGGWGVREGAFVYGYGLLGIPMETAFLVSVQVGLIGMLVSAALGLPSLILTRLPVTSSVTRFHNRLFKKQSGVAP